MIPCFQLQHRWFWICAQGILMKRNRQEQKAFTLVEVIFVIMVLGIVASIGSEIIAQVFKSYIVQRAQYRANTKTELALNQIANRLRYKIAGTVGARDSATSSFVPITDINDSEMSVLQWVAYDGDSFEAIASDSNRKPGWSGFCDLSASTATTISTPASNLNLATQIISNLGGNINNGVIYFPDRSDYNISNVSGTTITLTSAIPSGSSMYERYKLAWSSYALVVENGDLYLYYNFQSLV